MRVLAADHRLQLADHRAAFRGRPGHTALLLGEQQVRPAAQHIGVIRPERRDEALDSGQLNLLGLGQVTVLSDEDRAGHHRGQRVRVPLPRAPFPQAGDG